MSPSLQHSVRTDVQDGQHDGLPPGPRRVAYLALATATTMAVLDGTIANTALPRIGRELHASPSTAIWVLNGFQLAVTAALLPLAALGTLRGPARVYRAGVITFVVASLACAVSRSLPMLVAARVLQGFGAAGIMAIAPALLREIFPRRELGRALGINALVIATSSAAGPTLGGLILAVAHWSWLFLLNVPLGIVNIALNRALPADEARRGRLDGPSAIASGMGFAFVIWGLDGFSRGESGPSIGVRLGVAIVALTWFARRQFTLKVPMVALDLFGIAAFATSAAASWLTFVSQGLGFGFFQSPNNREFIGSSPRDKTASASGLLAVVRVSGQTLGATLVAIVFGAFGTAVVHDRTVGSHIARAMPVALWIACACATGAMATSALRLRRPPLVVTAQDQA